MAKNTARRPNIHWYMKDLVANGFAAEFEEYKDQDVIVGLYVPVAHLRAWLKLAEERVTLDELGKLRDVMKAHPVELTIRRNDEERTLIGTYNESQTCPPECT
jgi:hypothetical protein